MINRITHDPYNIEKKWLTIFLFFKRRAKMHVHVMSNKGEAKFWIDPELELAMNYGFSRKEIKEIEALIEERYNEFVNAWHRHFNS